MRQRRGRLAADDGGRFVDESVVFERRHHEQGEIYATGHVARQNEVAHVAAPYR